MREDPFPCGPSQWGEYIYRYGVTQPSGRCYTRTSPDRADSFGIDTRSTKQDLRHRHAMLSRSSLQQVYANAWELRTLDLSGPATEGRSDPGARNSVEGAEAK